MPASSQSMAKKVESMTKFELEVYSKRKTKEKLSDKWCDICGNEIPKGDEFWLIYTNCQKPILSACVPCADEVEVNK